LDSEAAVNFKGLNVKDVTVRFGGFTAVSSVSFQAKTGGITGIVGPNGAGKSSLMNAVMGLVPLATGSISIDGQEISHRAAWKRAGLGLGRAFQHVELFDSLSVAENVLLGRHHLMRYGVLSSALWLPPAREAELRHRAEVEKTLEFFELERWRDRQVRSLPYGVQKIVGLARAIAANPKVILLDEVGSGLTREEKENLARFVMRLQTQGSHAILWIEHDVGMVRDLSDHVVVLDYGRKLAEGNAADVFARSDVRAAFIGTRSIMIQGSDTSA
jgi:branched-chain amino acid transport system ATP-binding protein